MYLDELKYLYERAQAENPKNPMTSLAASLQTCERSVQRWLNEETTPIHRFKVVIHVKYEEVKGGKVS